MCQNVCWQPHRVLEQLDFHRQHKYNISDSDINHPVWRKVNKKLDQTHMICAVKQGGQKLWYGDWGCMSACGVGNGVGFLLKAIH